ncbi:accessory gland protein Acp29AB-like [Drosophila rhopaloa]|uniref:C-type lectin domain-containing protein n=1 Tax=Drosophila rhopaloa TaxID=1041015 RepID=A0ABM5HCU8_DRORH|nr:accessory gland protein Acp29AB-like [Drosophila rhopaloa]
MMKLATYYCYAFVVCNLYGVTRSQDASSLCVVKDAPKQCGAFCLASLHPLFDHNIKHRQTLTENNAKLDKIEGRQAAIESQLQELQVRVLGQLQVLQNAMESQKIQQGCGASLEGLTETADGETVHNDKVILPGFEQIGSRFFYIEKNNLQDWQTAEKSCRRKGGYLASIKNEEELAAIEATIKTNTWYWLGINDREKEDTFLSVASGKPAPILKWFMFIPKVKEIHCVVLSKYGMLKSDCAGKYYFICQGDNDI